MITVPEKLALLEAEADISQTRYDDFVASHPDWTVGAQFTDPDGFVWRVDFLSTARQLVTPVMTWINGGVDTRKQRDVFNLDEMTLVIV